MNKHISITILLLLFVNICKSQNIEIGQDSQEIKNIIEWSTKNHKRPDSFGNKSNSYWTYDTKYYNGRIVEVIQCYQNQYLIDFRVNADYCKRYIMENGKLSYILTQFENISTDQVKENYTSLYSKSKINDFYFDDNYKNYSKIYLAKFIIC